MQTAILTPNPRVITNPLTTGELIASSIQWQVFALLIVYVNYEFVFENDVEVEEISIKLTKNIYLIIKSN